MPDMEQCAAFKTFCADADVAAGFPKVCTQDAADGERRRARRGRRGHARKGGTRRPGGSGRAGMQHPRFAHDAHHSAPALLEDVLSSRLPPAPAAGRRLPLPPWVPHTGCAGSSSSLPPMKMWFHQSAREMFLFKEWVPNNSERACVGCRGLPSWAAAGGWLRGCAERPRLMAPQPCVDQRGCPARRPTATKYPPAPPRLPPTPLPPPPQPGSTSACASPCARWQSSRRWGAGPGEVQGEARDGGEVAGRVQAARL